MAEVYLIGFSVLGTGLYVGITSKTADSRLRQHLSEAQRHSANPIHRAIHKYGQKSIRLMILHNNVFWEEACRLERWYIKALRTRVESGGYNLTDGGDGTVGRISSRRQRQAVSEMNHRRWQNPTTRRAILTKVRQNQEKAAAANRGRKLTPTQLRKLQSATDKAAKVNHRRWLRDKNYRAKMLKVLERGRKKHECVYGIVNTGIILVRGEAI